MDIDFGDAKSPIGYDYVLTLDGGVLSWKYVKNCSHDLPCKHKLFFFPMHIDNQIIIFKVFSKNVNEIEKLTYENERQIY